jgi:hypothetical protein
VIVPEETAPNHTEQLRNELRSVMDRWSKESDLTYCELLGVIELLKAEVLDHIRNTD